MDKELFELKMQAEGSQNFLVLDIPEDCEINEYCCKMLEKNTIAGLLPMRHQILNGSLRLRYSLSGKVRLTEYVVQHRLSYQNGLLLLQNLTKALLHLEEYFLSAYQCVFDPQQVYVGDGLQCYLVCVPVDPANITLNDRELQSFYERLLSDCFAVAGSTEFDEMFKWTYRTSLFDLQTFYDKFLKEPAAPVQPTALAALQSQRMEEVRPEPLQPKPMPVQETHDRIKPEIADKLYNLTEFLSEETQKKQEESQPKAQPAPDMGFKIPGVSGGAAPKKPEKKAAKAAHTQEKEKKSFWPFGKKEKKKEESAPTEKHTAQPFAVPFAAPAPAQPAAPTAPQPQRRAQAAPVPQAEDWNPGTILVDEDDDRTAFGDDQAAPQRVALLYQGQRIEIVQTPFVIGKYNTIYHLDYAIYGNDKVSRNHAEIVCQGGRYLLKDNQSRNGTFLNGRRLDPNRPQELKNGDQIRLYNEQFTFEQD